jgi:hypothetical protein
MLKRFIPIIVAAIIIVTYKPVITQTSSSIIDEGNSPSIDGKIKESEWRTARVFTEFYTFVPKSDSKNYDSTIVYVKQSKDAIYLAFKYWPKGKIITKSLNRDMSTEEENEFFILLDLENKGQNGYFFSFNFIDNQRDALVFNSRNMSSEWDWVWESKSTIFSLPKDGKPGYIETEIKIPVDKLQNKCKDQIGLDIQMFSYKPDGSYYWYSISPNSELMNLRTTYKLDIKPFDEKLNINFNALPFFVGNKFNDSTYKAQFGGEFNISFDKHKLKGTINTDESTLEADPFRFSFYGRPIFLTEKRPFFSKDLDMYRTPINLFYTRAIDKIDFGFNYTFRSNSFKTGAVYVEQEKDANGNKKRYFITRPKYNSDLFNLGGMYIYSEDKSNDYKENILSFDGKLNLPSRFRFVPQFATNFKGNAYDMHLYYEQNSSGPYGDLQYRRFDEKFEASTMFNDYGNDYDEIIANAGYKIIRDTKYLNDIGFGTSYYRARTLSDKFTYQEAVSGNVYYKLNGWISISHYLEYNRPDGYNASGEIENFKNVLQEHSIKFIFGDNTFTAGYLFGKYYGSYLKSPYLNLDLSFYNRLSLNISYNYRSIDAVDQHIFRAKLDFKVMDKLYLRSFFQKDTYNRLALWNTMIQYEFFAGSNVYLVLNLEGEKLQNTRRYFKVGYEFNF